MSILLTHNNYRQEQWKKENISSPIVDFRIAGKPEIRRYDARKFNSLTLKPIQLAQDFVDTYCRPFCVLNGADIRTVKQVLIPADCDWFIQRHEWEI